MKFLSRLMCVIGFVGLGNVLGIAGNIGTPGIDLVAKPALDAKSRNVVCSINGKGKFHSDWAFITQPGKQLTLSILPIGEGGGNKWKSLNKKFFSISDKSNVSVSSTQIVNWTLGECDLEYADNETLRLLAPVKPGTFSIGLSGKELNGLSLVDALDGIISEATQTQYKLNLLVSYPFDREDTTIEGYAVGFYPNEEKPKGNTFVEEHKNLYRPPKWFIRVTPENKNLHLSKHFILGDFFTRIDPIDAGFIALNPKLINYLEKMVETLDRRGLKGDGLRILRAYLTPIEIMKLQRKGLDISDFTRYIYGDSVAIIVDADNNNKMDDINGDGTIDMGDARFLGDLFRRVQREIRLVGGIGTYGKATDEYLPPDTPYVQIDLRGAYARW